MTVEPLNKIATVYATVIDEASAEVDANWRKEVEKQEAAAKHVQEDTDERIRQFNRLDLSHDEMRCMTMVFVMTEMMKGREKSIITAEKASELTAWAFGLTRERFEELHTKLNEIRTHCSHEDKNEEKEPRKGEALASLLRALNGDR